MRNLIFHQTHLQRILQSDNLFPLAYYIDEFCKLLLVIDSEFKILLFSYENNDVFSNFVLKKTIELDLLLSLSDDGNEILNELKIGSETVKIDSNNSPIKLLIYKNEEESVHLVFRSGKYACVNISDLVVNIKTLTSVKILCVEVSPNLENIVAICSNFTISLYNYDFGLINSCNLDDGDNSDAIKDNNICKEASVSWRGDSQYFCVLYTINGGRKCLVRDNNLSIFKGPARADNKVVYSVSEAPVSNLENLVSWQPSGSLISFFQENTILKENKIINDMSMKAGVLFSEKNCLRHGEFYLDKLDGNYIGKKVNAKILKWNMDLPLLLVYLKITSENSKEEHIINFYYRSNYDWSLKFSYPIQHELFHCKFSETCSLRLFLLYTNSDFQCIDFKLEYQNSLSNNNLPDDNGTISVLSGNKIKFTPLGEVNIPPPMAHSTIFLENTLPPYSLSWWRNYLFVLSNGKFDIIKMCVSDRSYTLVNQFELSLKFSVNYVKSFIFVFNEPNLCGYLIINKLVPNEDSYDELVIVPITLNSGENEIKFSKIGDVLIKKVQRCSGLINSIKSERNYLKKVLINKNKTEDISNNSENEKDLFYGINIKESKKNVESEKIYFYMINIDGNEKQFNKIYLNESSPGEIEIDIEKMDVCSNFEIIKTRSIITYNNEEKIVFLTKNNRLFINNTLLAIEITSFEFFKNFLLFTQSSNSPYNTIHLLDVSKENYLSSLIKSTESQSLITADFNYKSFSMRTVERSSMIVTVSKINVVLQMSRGNLETIYPRLLVLSTIIELIVNDRDYRQVMELVRKHKINMNFVYDVNPEGFLNNITAFISQVGKSEYFNLFLNSLENSISEEMLQLDPDVNSREDFKKLFIYNKVNRICVEMRKELQKQNIDNKYITSILHTYCKISPPEHFEALKLVQNLKISEKTSTGMTMNADKALEYLCWVVNADTLFDFSLKTYDFELVIMVAKHTQKDPKEYLSYLKRLQDLVEVDPVLMKYQVNIDLKHYSDALKELSVSGMKYFDKSVEIFIKYELYELAIKLFSFDDEILRIIYKHYGDYLYGKRKYADAGWAYFKSGKNNYHNSLKSFVEAGCFNQTNELINLISNDESIQINEILSEIIDICSSAKKYSELEKIHLYVIQNQMIQEEKFENIQIKLMDTLIRCKIWKIAYLFSTQVKSIEVVKCFTNGIGLSANLIINQLKKNITLFEEKFNRLLKVQHLKRTQPHLFEIEIKERMDDNVSDSGSVVSGKSYGSSKSKKTSSSKVSKTSKMTKKSMQKISKRNVKEGSPLEEEYLIVILSELKISNEDVENYGDLIDVLNFIKLTISADELKNILSYYIDNINSTIPKIFSVAQIDFINTHPEIKDLFPNLNLGGELKIKSEISNGGIKTFKTTSG